MLLVCVYRPEDAQAGEPLAAVAAQAAGAYTTAISLRELSTAQSSQLLTTLLAGAELPAATRDLILATGQGNPFFLEEIVRVLIERGLLDQHDGVWQVAPTLARVTTPESVQQVILSRVDQLTPAQKRLLQSAAVVGRLFRPRVLATLLPHEGKLDQLLAELTDQAFIDQERSLPEREYAFHHVLTQDAIYHALPEQRRVRLHQQVAEGLEQLYSTDLEAYPEQLAYHYDHSGTSHSAKAIEFLACAGEKARRAYLNDAALDYYARAARRLAELPPTAAVQSWQLVVARGQGLIYLTTTHFTEAEHYLRQAIDWAAALGVSLREQARLYGWLCRMLRSQSRIDEVVQVCEAGLALFGYRSNGARSSESLR